jgi:acetolactate synthase-1/2/3 large subunit
MKVSDYVADFLAQQGIGHVFVVQGGAAAHLIDSVAHHPKLTYVCPAHEQASAMAADGYVRATGGLGCAIATTGPGVLNMVTGIASLYYDSLPGIFIGGQVSTFRLTANASGVRQLGFQEAPHVDIVKPITKYAVMVDDPTRIRYELEKAVHIATTGRPGPVFIDICDDVQRMHIEPAQLEGYVPPGAAAPDAELELKLDKALELLAKAERPVLVLGAAVHVTKTEDAALRLIKRLGIPVALTWAAMDLMSGDDPLNIGGFGVSATRRGNFAVQNADFVLSIGSRLDTHATGTPINTFAREAVKVIVDIDRAELNKFPKGGMNVDVSIQSDVRDVFQALERRWNAIMVKDVSPWIKEIARLRKTFPSCPPAFRKQKGSINPYYFLEILANETANDDILIPDTGANLAQTFQGYSVHIGQKLFSAFNNTPMGYSLPASIGACFANRKRRVICITGDGGLQVNMQELGTVVRYSLPIKIFVFNNHGYGIIQQTQEDWLDARYHGSRAESGLMDPDYTKIGRAFGIEAITISEHRGLRAKIRKALASDGPVLVNLQLSDKQRIFPMLKAGRPIEDANPLLDRKEFLENMIVKPLAVSLVD